MDACESGEFTVEERISTFGPGGTDLWAKMCADCAWSGAGPPVPRKRL